MVQALALTTADSHLSMRHIAQFSTAHLNRDFGSVDRVRTASGDVVRDDR
jgi:hypothetical protein